MRPILGPVRAVTHNVGDVVRRGQTLARVESAESLQTYSIVTPISGVVLERQTNIGDVTSEDPLFVVGDLSRLQAELNVVTRDIGRVAPGQSVLITGLDGTTRIEARIASVLPTADAHSQTLIARAPLTIPQGSPLRPGMAVRASVVLTEQQVPIAVRARRGANARRPHRRVRARIGRHLRSAPGHARPRAAATRWRSPQASRRRNLRL